MRGFQKSDPLSVLLVRVVPLFKRTCFYTRVLDLRRMTWWLMNIPEVLFHLDLYVLLFSWADAEIKTSWCIPQSKKPVDAIAGLNYQHHTRVPSISTSSADQSGPKTYLICLKIDCTCCEVKPSTFLQSLLKTLQWGISCCGEDTLGIDSQYFASLRLFQCGMCDFVLE